MGPVAQEVCVAAGSGQIFGPDGVIKITQVLRDYFAQDPGDSIYRGVFRFLRLKWSTQFMDEHLVRLDPLPRKAESEIRAGGAFPETLAPMSRIQNGYLARRDKSLALANVQGDLRIAAVAHQIRRRFGPCGGVA